jgi:hypothetical protein
VSIALPERSINGWADAKILEVSNEAQLQKACYKTLDRSDAVVGRRVDDDNDLIRLLGLRANDLSALPIKCAWL